MAQRCDHDYIRAESIMTREKVRSLKRALTASSRTDATPEDKRLAGESALSLLARNIDFGHGRLAVVRLAMAVNTGAQVPRDHWLYCARVAQASQDRGLQDLYISAATNAGGEPRETTSTSSLS